MSRSLTLFDIEFRDETAVVTPRRSLGELSFQQLAEEADLLLTSFQQQPLVKNVVIDFHKTDYIGSTALGLLTKCWKCVRQRGGRMVLCRVSAHEQEILHLTKMDSLWPVCATLEEALASVAQAGAEGCRGMAVE